MSRDFSQIEWNAALAADCLRLVRTAIQEDLGRGHDWTTLALIPPEATGRAAVVSRQAGVVAGLPTGPLLMSEIDPAAVWEQSFAEGARIEAGTTVATILGPARSLLVAERTLLNLIGRLSGVATLTRRFVDAVAAVAGARAHVYDTRKTTPGWRRLEKYAVRQGGGRNHRMGLYDGLLIKDNHLAVLAAASPTQRLTPAEAVRRARSFLDAAAAEQVPGSNRSSPMLIEVEVDTLDQLQQVLPAGPDIVLLDNMSLEDLRRAVQLRDVATPQIELEASGGIRLETIGAVAGTGVDRISVGALTHAAIGLDFGLDWVV